MKPPTASEQQAMCPLCECIRVRLANGRELVLPVEILSEDRVAGSVGDHPLDRIEVIVAGETVWCERRDLCDDSGEPINWSCNNEQE